MSGIAALAAAAAATPRINTPSTASSPGIKVVTPTIVTPQGVRVTPVQGESSELYSMWSLSSVKE